MTKENEDNDKIKEIWIPIKNYEKFYEISNLGRVRSYINNKWGLSKKPKILKGLIGKHYKTVCLKGKTFYIHRLVAEHFIPNTNNFTDVNHKDGNKLNNSVNNLEWCTHEQNMKHAKENNLFGQQKKIICIETGEIFDSITKASEQKRISRTAINNCLKKISNTSGKLNWKYY